MQRRASSRCGAVMAPVGQAVMQALHWPQWSLVAPVSGRLLKLMPHAYIVVTSDHVGVLVHLGLDTVTLNGAGFTAHVSQGDGVTAGQVVIGYDVPAVEATGLNPIVAVVVMDERVPEHVTLSAAVTSGADIDCGATLFTAHQVRQD